MAFSNDLFYLAGALRDGSLFYDKASRNYTMVWYSNNAKYLKKSIVKRLARSFSKKSKVYEYKKGQYRVKIGDMELYSKIKQTFDFPDKGLGQVRWGTSKALRKAPTLLKHAYIVGMFDAEGDVSLRNRYVEVCQKNTEILKWIKRELKASKINSGGIVLADRKSSTYKLVISEKRSVMLFAKKIGFELEYKKRMLNALCLR